MKILSLLGAGLLAVGTLGTVAVPTAADAQRHGWNDRHRGSGHYRAHRDGYHGGYRQRGYRGHYGYRGRGYRGGRVICRVHRGYRGPVRTCVRR